MAAVAAEARGAVCSDVTDSDQRLACYDRLAECVTTHDPRARLECYDQAQEPAERQTAWADEEPGRRDDEQAAPEADEAFPVPGKAVREELKQDSRLVAQVVEVAEDARGRQYLTLDNGQVWRELADGRMRFEPGDEVEIRSGILGSVNLRVAGKDGYVKVRRVE